MCGVGSRRGNKLLEKTKQHMPRDLFLYKTVSCFPSGKFGCSHYTVYLAMAKGIYGKKNVPSYIFTEPSKSVSKKRGVDVARMYRSLPRH